MYAIGTDGVLKKITDKYCNTVAYADDILIAVNSEEEAAEAIEFAKKLLAEIGLSVNDSKCKYTKREDVKYLGVTFMKDGKLKLAEQLHQKAQYLRKVLKHFKGIDAAKRWAILRQSCIAQVNYGPSIETQAMLADENEQKLYEAIDEIVATMADDILGLSAVGLSIDQMVAVLVGEYGDGGA